MTTEAIYDATVTGKCQETVITYSNGFPHSSPCHYNAGYRDGDMVYCKTHHPATVKLRRAAKERRWAAKERRWTTEDKARDRQIMMIKACEGVSTEQLTPGILKQLLDAEEKR